MCIRDRCLLCFEALDAEDEAALWRFDREMAAATLASETRNGNRLIAKQMLNLVKRIAGEDELLDRYRKRISAGESSGHPAIVFSIFAHREGIPYEECFVMYGYSIASTLSLIHI